MMNSKSEFTPCSFASQPVAEAVSKGRPDRSRAQKPWRQPGAAGHRRGSAPREAEGGRRRRDARLRARRAACDRHRAAVTAARSLPALTAGRAAAVSGAGRQTDTLRRGAPHRHLPGAGSAARGPGGLDQLLRTPTAALGQRSSWATVLETVSDCDST